MDITIHDIDRILTSLNYSKLYIDGGDREYEDKKRELEGLDLHIGKLSKIRKFAPIKVP